MSDNNSQGQEPQENPNTTDTTAGDTKEQREMSPEDLRAALDAARKEAAGYRTANKELRAKADKFDELEEAKKSELEKAQERIAQLEKDKADLTLSAVRSEVAARFGVPADMIAGADEESLVASAERLKEWAEGQSPKPAGAPHVPEVGRDSGGEDKDALARAVFGIA